MDILFKNARFEQECNNSKLLVKRHGAVRAKLIRRRLDSLRAAIVLEDLRNTPGRLHELRGDRKWQLSLDLDGPYRLIFVPGNDPVPFRRDGGLDWSRISIVIVLGIEDTHE